VVVYWDSNRSQNFTPGVDEEYTRLTVQKGNSLVTEFSVFWLVPNKNYYVEVYLGDPDVPANREYFKIINKSE